jgi:hypothetical protein
MPLGLLTGSSTQHNRGPLGLHKRLDFKLIAEVAYPRSPLPFYPGYQSPQHCVSGYIKPALRCGLKRVSEFDRTSQLR